jgi:hypothetical protein
MKTKLFEVDDGCFMCRHAINLYRQASCGRLKIWCTIICKEVIEKYENCYLFECIDTFSEQTED